VYEMESPYPTEVGSQAVQGAMRGFEFAEVAIVPLRFIPAMDSLFLHTRVEVTLTLEQLEAEIAASRVQRAPERQQYSLYANEVRWVRTAVNNPDDLDRFYRRTRPGEEIESTPFGGFEPTELPCHPSRGQQCRW
jgi:hypothetical protein